jgi:hypothetical protein
MNHIYDACGNLRDFAMIDEKEAWNKTRGMFYSDAQKFLRALDNKLSPAGANEMLPDYSSNHDANQTKLF